MDIQAVNLDLSSETRRVHFDKRRLFINGTIDEATVDDIVMALERFCLEDEEAEATQTYYERSPITLFVNSPGGYCTHGLALVSAIEQSGTPVITVAQGLVASMALLVFTSGHLRVSYRHTEFLCHQHSSGAIGTHQDQIEHVEYGKEVQKRLDDILISRTRITRAQLRKAHEQKRDWTFFPEEALKLGVADEIMPLRLKVPKPKRGK